MHRNIQDNLFIKSSSSAAPTVATTGKEPDTDEGISSCAFNNIFSHEYVAIFVIETIKLNLKHVKKIYLFIFMEKLTDM